MEPRYQGADRNWGRPVRAQHYETAIALDRHLHANPQDSSARRCAGASYFMIKTFQGGGGVWPILKALPDNPSCSTPLAFVGEERIPTPRTKYSNDVGAKSRRTEVHLFRDRPTLSKRMPA
jgi:hypothetical protein